LIPLKQISTSLLERLNGTIRQNVVPLHRKRRALAKRRTALDTQAQLFKSYYNLCRKHGTLKGKTPAQAAHPERPLLDAQRITNLQRGNYFKNPVGSTSFGRNFEKSPTGLQTSEPVLLNRALSGMNKGTKKA
jgi:hypothetical protein